MSNLYIVWLPPPFQLESSQKIFLYPTLTPVWCVLRVGNISLKPLKPNLGGLSWDKSLAHFNATDGGRVGYNNK